MTYAQKNHGKITFHKILDFAKSPAAYKAIYEDLLGREVKKECFIEGEAIENYIFGKQDRYEVVARRSSEPTEKIQLTRATGEMVQRASAEILSNPFGAIKGEKTHIEVGYKGETLSGEVDELFIGDFEAMGMKFGGYVADIKTCASFDSFDKFLPQYLQQLAYYQFLTCVKYDLEPLQIAGIIKVVTKDTIPMSRVLLALPQRLKENWHWISDLEALVEARKTGNFGTLTWADTIKFPEIYGLVKQPEYQLL